MLGKRVFQVCDGVEEGCVCFYTNYNLEASSSTCTRKSSLCISFLDIRPKTERHMKYVGGSWGGITLGTKINLQCFLNYKSVRQCHLNDMSSDIRCYNRVIMSHLCQSQRGIKCDHPQSCDVMKIRTNVS